jgi:dienelactone hydrolase
MNGRPIPILAVIVLVATALARPAAADAEAVAKARAREVLKLLVQGRYQDFTTTFDEKMRAAMSADEVARIWANVQLSVGPYKSEESVTVTSAEALQSVRFVGRCERGRITMRIILDRDGRVSGLWFDEVKPIDAYQPPDYVRRDAFREEGVSVSAGKHPLPGTLSLPVSSGPHPGLVLIHGSGPLDQDGTVGGSRPLRDLAWGLASRSVAVLRFEKRTKAHPRARKPDEWTLDEEVIDDALAAIKLLRARPEIDPRRVFVLGHSLGGFAAPFIAQRDGQLAGLVLLAGTPRSIIELIQDQSAYLAMLDGSLSPEEQQRLIELAKFMAAVRDGRLEQAPAIIGVPVKYVAALHALKPLEAANATSTPMLILQGGRDYQVTQKDFDAWREGLAGRKGVTFELYPSLNHLFVSGEGQSSPAEYQRGGHVDESVIRDVVAWITATSEQRSGGAEPAPASEPPGAPAGD